MVYLNPLGGNFQVNGIASFAPLGRWKPVVGDFVIYNGLIKHWFGVVSGTGEGFVEVVHGVLPLTVFTSGPQKAIKNTKKIDTVDILTSSGGKYAVIQTIGGMMPVVYLA